MTEAATVELLDESASNEESALARVIEDDWQLILRARDDFGSRSGPRDVERLTRVLRCAATVGRSEELADEFEALASMQQADGGFAERSDGASSSTAASTACGIALIGASGALQRPPLAAAVRRTIDYLLSAYGHETAAADPSEVGLRTTAGLASFFHLVVARGETYRRDELERRRQRARGALLAAGIAGDRPDVVETAELLQGLAPDMLLGDDSRVARTCAIGLGEIERVQGRTGAWADSVERTASCLRAAMVVSRLLALPALQSLAETGARADSHWIERGYAWLLAARNDVGWGESPDGSSSVERTCDGLETMVAYHAFRSGEARAIARLLGHAE